MIESIEKIEVSGDVWFNASDLLSALGYADGRGKRVQVLSDNRKFRYLNLKPNHFVDKRLYWNENTLEGLKNLIASSPKSIGKLENWEKAMSILNNTHELSFSTETFDGELVDFIDNIEVNGKVWFSAAEFLEALGYSKSAGGTVTVLLPSYPNLKYKSLSPNIIKDDQLWWGMDTLPKIKHLITKGQEDKWDTVVKVLKDSLPKPKQTLLKRPSHVDYKSMYENVLNDHQELKKATDVLKLKFDKDNQKVLAELKEAQDLIKQLKESPQFDADTELFLDQHRNELKRLRHENEKIEGLEIKLLCEYKNIRTLEGKLSKAETINKQLETTIRVLEEKLKTANLTTLKSKEILDKKISVVTETIVDNVILGFKVGNKTTVETKEYRLEDLVDLDIKAIKL